MEKDNEKLDEKEMKAEESEQIEETEQIEKIEQIDSQENSKEIATENVEAENKIENPSTDKELIEQKETEKQKEESKNILENKEQRKNYKKILILSTAFIIFFFVLSTIFAIMNVNNSNIVKGVYIENLNVSGLNKEEVNSIVNEKIAQLENIEIGYKEYSEIIKLEDIGIEINAKEAIREAVNIGKSNNILIDNYCILKANLFKTKLKLNISINEEKFEEIVKNIGVEIPEAVQEYSYEIKDNELIITRGKQGKKVEKEELKEKIIREIEEKFNDGNIFVNIPVKDSQPEEINIEKIYNEIYKEAKDAYINEDGENIDLHKEEDGIDFEISIDEAKEIISEDKETYTIPLKITKPKVKVKDLGDKLFKQTLSKYTTIYDAGNYNRSHNISLAAKTVNGTILLPGETFSYNGILGNTNKEKGYKVGTAYSGGKVIESYGGGICQLSSTIYNAALYANLEIVERHNHSYAVNYVPAGRDATVAYGGKNFRFKNNRKYPIKIESNAKNGVVSVSIKGIKEETEYEVVLTSSVLSSTPNKTVYQQNSNLEEGKQKVIQKGYVGRTSIAYKTLKINGETISKTVLSKDVYKPMEKIIEVGTKKAIPTQVVPTDPTPSVPTTPEVPEAPEVINT